MSGHDFDARGVRRPGPLRVAIWVKSEVQLVEGSFGLLPVWLSEYPSGIVTDKRPESLTDNLPGHKKFYSLLTDLEVKPLNICYPIHRLSTCSDGSELEPSGVDC